MNRSDLITAVAQHQKLGEVLVEDVLGGFFEVLVGTIARNEEVAIRGFGKFEPRTRKSITLRHVGNGKPIQTGDRRTMVFKPSMATKDRLNTAPSS